MKELKLLPLNETDQKLVNQCDDSVKHRRMVELAITRALIKMLNDEGFDLVADNGEEKLTDARSADEMIECLFACDEAELRASNDSVSGRILLVLGNDGWDIIADYTLSLEKWMDPFLDWINGEQERQVPA